MNLKILYLAGFTALMGACADDPAVPRSQSRMFVAPEAVPPRPYTTDSAFMSITVEVPGFAGFYFDATGNLHAQLTDLEHTARAIEQLTPFLAEFRGVGHIRGPIGRVITHTVNFRIQQLLQWQTLVYELMKAGAAFGTDVDEVRNVVVVFTENPDTSGIRSWLLTRNVPDEAVIIEVARRPQPIASLTDRIRPLLPGSQIGGGGTCTLGPLLRYDNLRSAVVNSHCTAVYFGGTGTVLYQNAFGSGNRFGVEIADVTIATMPNICPTGIPNCRYSDAAIIQLDDSVNWDAGSIAFTYSPSQDSTTNVIDPNATRTVNGGPGIIDWVGNTVYKTGRSSGTTFGTVVNSNYSYFTSTGVALIAQSVVEAAVRPGDSGSPVFRQQTGNYVDLMGIVHSAYDTTYTKFIFSDLYGIFFDFSGAWTGSSYEHTLTWCTSSSC